MNMRPHSFQSADAPSAADSPAAPQECPPTGAAVASHLPLGTRIRLRSNGELGTVVPPRASTYELGCVSVALDDEDGDITRCCSLESIEVLTDPRDPDPTREGIFRDHNCWKCQDGELLCVQGNPRQCEYPYARND